MRIDLPQARKSAHQITIPIRWGDMDAQGHVNNVQYFRYMETARIDWLQGIRSRFNAPQGQGGVVGNAFCNFLRQLEYPADIVVKTSITPPGRSSFETWVEIEKADAPGILHATGGATLVWMDSRTGRAAPLPEQLLEILAEILNK
jgi:acyl-CoA thioester hydrolase